MTEATHTIRVTLSWSTWLTLQRFCRHHGYDEAEYLAWLARASANKGASGRFPLPSMFDGQSLQAFDEA